MCLHFRNVIKRTIIERTNGSFNCYLNALWSVQEALVMICYHRQLRILVARGPRPEYDETIEGSLYKMETFSMTTDIRIF